jgi:hypothetical protein
VTVWTDFVSLVTLQELSHHIGVTEDTVTGELHGLSS